MLNADHIISIFFPQVSTESNLPTVQVDPDKIAEVTTEEVLWDTKKIVENKAPVLDGILNKTLLRTVKVFPNWQHKHSWRAPKKIFSRKSVTNKS